MFEKLGFVFWFDTILFKYVRTVVARIILECFRTSISYCSREFWEIFLVVLHEYSLYASNVTRCLAIDVAIIILPSSYVVALPQLTCVHTYQIEQYMQLILLIYPVRQRLWLREFPPWQEVWCLREAKWHFAKLASKFASVHVCLKSECVTVNVGLFALWLRCLCSWIYFASAVVRL